MICESESMRRTVEDTDAARHGAALGPTRDSREVADACVTPCTCSIRSILVVPRNQQSLRLAGCGEHFRAMQICHVIQSGICNSRGVGWTLSETTLLGSALLLVGSFPLSPLKHACLSSCRSPLSYFTRQWKTGYSRGLRMGLSYGIICVGWCWALMALMFLAGTGWHGLG